MSQKSRRFHSSRESARLAASPDRVPGSDGQHIAALVPALSKAMDKDEQKFSITNALAQVRAKVAERVGLDGGGYLQQAQKQIAGITDKVVTWGKQHPARMVIAATALVAVTGLLVKVVHGKAEKIPRVIKLAKRGKAAIKNRVRTAVKKAARRVGGSLRKAMTAS